jgi:putative SOS response-associated peptidase YedK
MVLSMCGRFAITLPIEAMARLFESVPANDLPLGENYNVCPTDPVAVVTSQQGVRRLRPMRWGFIPQWYKTPSDGPLLINARAETVAEKPAFRAACRARRCVIPATGFYEWTKDAQDNRLPWYIAPKDGAPILFAGIWQDWGPPEACLSTCAIVTSAAGDHPLSAIHHRMPVSLAPEDVALWLGERGKGAARLMVPAPVDRFGWHRVGVAVNSNRAAGPELTEPLRGAG